MDIALIIKLSLYAFLIISLVLGCLLGIKRGLIKSSIRLSTFVILIIIAGFITMPISKSILTSINNTNFIEGMTFSEYIIKLILPSQEIYEDVSSMPSVMELINSLPLILISIIVFISLILIVLLISWIVYFLITKLFLRQSRLERKAKKQEKLAIKSSQLIKPNNMPIIIPKKKLYRTWGGVVGTIFGFIFAFVLLIPITSLTSTISDIASQNKEVVYAENEILSETSSDLLHYYVGEDILSYIDSYSQSIPGKILKLGGFDDVLFDSITSFNVNDEKIKIRKDFSNVAKIYDKTIYLIDEIGKLEQYKNIDFDKINDIISNAFDITLFKAVAEEAIPYALDYFYQTDYFKDLSYKNDLKIIINQFVSNLAKDSKGFINSLKEDILSISNVAKSACEIGILDYIMGGEENYQVYINALKTNDYQVIKSISNNLLNSYSLKNAITDLSNFGLKIISENIDNNLNLNTLNFKNVNWVNLKNNFNKMAITTLDIYSLLEKYDIEKLINNYKFFFSKSFLTKDFETLINLVANEIELIQFSPLFVNQEINPFNVLIDYLGEQESYSNFIDSEMLKNSNLKQEILSISKSLITLKSSDIFSYLINADIIKIEDICLLLKNDTENKTYTNDIIQPLLDSKLMQKTIKYGFEQINNNLDAIQNNFDSTITKIDLSNFTYLSYNDKQYIIKTIDNLIDVILYVDNGSFENGIIQTIISLNDFENEKYKSEYVLKTLNSLSKISILRPTYNSIFTAIKQDENYSDYINTDIIIKEDFDWMSELNIINTILDIAEKENEGMTIIKLLYPDNKIVEINIKNELISNIFKIIKLPLNDLEPNISAIEVLINTLYNSQIFKNSLQFLINTLNFKILETLSTSDNKLTVSKVTIEDITINQKEQIINIIEALAECFDIVTSETFKIDNLTENECELVGLFLNRLKENAYDYKNGQPNDNCTISSDGKTVVNGGVFAELYITLISYFKKTSNVTTDSYSTVDWITFIKSLNEISKVIESSGNILDIVTDKESNVELGNTLEVAGVNTETASKVDEIQNSFNEINSESSSENFENLSNSLDNITQEDTTEIVEVIKDLTGKDLSTTVNEDIFKNEKIVSSRISLLMSNIPQGELYPLGITDENLIESLTDLCNGATYVLTQAVNSNIVLNCNINGGLETLALEIDNFTDNETVKNLVKFLFGIN